MLLLRNSAGKSNRHNRRRRYQPDMSFWWVAILVPLSGLSSVVLAESPAAKYGYPTTGQLIEQEGFLLGYDGFFKSARWVLYRLEPIEEGVERSDEFRDDPRVDREFRPALSDYVGAKTREGTPIDRGHLVPSNDMRESRVANSDTFLMSNISPQDSSFNRGTWLRLESLVRTLASQDGVRECYVMSGPAIAPDETGTATLQFIGDSRVPVPTHYWKSVLVVVKSGRIKVWSVLLPNRKTPASVELESFEVTVNELESITGLDLWEKIANDVEEDIESKLESWKL